jgi:hypothetical protein
MDRHQKERQSRHDMENSTCDDGISSLDDTGGADAKSIWCQTNVAQSWFVGEAKRVEDVKYQ